MTNSENDLKCHPMRFSEAESSLTAENSVPRRDLLTPQENATPPNAAKWRGIDQYVDYGLYRSTNLIYEYGVYCQLFHFYYHNV